MFSTTKMIKDLNKLLTNLVLMLMLLFLAGGVFGQGIIQTVEYPGAFYVGEIRNGLRHGQGTLTFVNGDVSRIEPVITQKAVSKSY